LETDLRRRYNHAKLADCESGDVSLSVTGLTLHFA